MNESKTALFLGRFQPPSIAHAHTLEVIRRRWQKVVIIVTHVGSGEQNGYPEEWREFIRISEANFLAHGSYGAFLRLRGPQRIAAVIGP